MNKLQELTSDTTKLRKENEKLKTQINTLCTRVNCLDLSANKKKKVMIQIYSSYSKRYMNVLKNRIILFLMLKRTLLIVGQIPLIELILFLVHLI